MSKVFNSCSLYLGIRCLYALQGALYPSGGIMSKSLLVLYLILSLYFIIISFSKYRFPYILRGVTALFLLLSSYGVFLLFTNEELYAAGMYVPKFEYIKSIMLSFPPIYACFHFAKQNQLNEHNIRFWILSFLFIAILSYFRVQNEVMLAIGSDTVTNNMAYSFVALLPSLFLFYRNTFLQYLLLCVCLIFILLSMKRGAILIGIVALLYFLYSSSTFAVKKNNKILKCFLTIGVVVFIAYIFKDLMVNNEYFITRLDSTLEGNSSNRDDLYSFFWSYFKNQTNILQFLFGHGANGTLSIYVDYAHNDWLELAINQGVLGLVVYSIYWIMFIKSIKLYRHSLLMKKFLVMFFIVFFIKSIFSMSYIMSFYATVVLGYMIGIYDNSRGKSNV